MRSTCYIPHILVEDIAETQPAFDMVEGQHGLVYVCPQCGDAWAKIVLFTADGMSGFRSTNLACREHGGGSFLDKYVHAISPHWQVTPYFGAKITLRELELALTHGKGATP